MKKLLTATMALTLIFSAQAEAKSSLWEKVKDYGLPCAAGFLGGMLVDKDAGPAVGVGVCLGVGAATYLSSKREAKELQDQDIVIMKKMLSEHSAQLAAEQDKRIAESVKQMESRQSDQIEAVRQVMKEVIAERMAVIAEENKAEVRRHLEQSGFMKDMESKIMLKIKEEVQAENKVNKKDIVEQCVDETLKQVVLKRVGVPGDTP